MEDNELNFCSLWTEKISLDKGVDLLVNKKFKDDYFFNRLNYLSASAKKSTIEKSIAIFSEKGLDCNVYLHENKELENLLLSKGFALLDTMHVLKAQPKKTVADSNRKYIQVDFATLSDWVHVFCKSFEIQELKSDVEKIIRSNFKKFVLLLSIVNGVPAGCIALYNKNNLTGIYCLGTIPSFRQQGVAEGLLAFAVQLSDENGSDFSFLQTLQKDNFIKFYKRTGLTVQYTKKIYSLKAIDASLIV